MVVPKTLSGLYKLSFIIFYDSKIFITDNNNIILPKSHYTVILKCLNLNNVHLVCTVINTDVWQVDEKGDPIRDPATGLCIR